LTGPLGYLTLAAALSAAVVVPLALASALTSERARLYAEGGVVESLSAACWLLVLVLSPLAARRHAVRLDRLLFAWLIVFSVLAGARELDLHVLLNPSHLGELGVRYRITWFFARDVNVLRRLVWSAVALLLATSLIAPLVALRRPMARLMREGDAAVGLLLLAVGCLAAGYVADDVLRGTQVVPLDLRQAWEETLELLGALFFVTSTGCLFFRPLSTRARQDAAPVRPRVSQAA
jgi:hypothetical protein